MSKEKAQDRRVPLTVAELDALSRKVLSGDELEVLRDIAMASLEEASEPESTARRPG